MGLDIAIRDQLAALLRYLDLDSELRLQVHLISSGKSLSGLFKCENITRERARSKYHLHDGRMQRDMFSDRDHLATRSTCTELRGDRLAFPRRDVSGFRWGSRRHVQEAINDVFVAYCFQNNRRGVFMGPMGFLKLMRDAQILDNKTTQADLHHLFKDLEHVGMSSDGGDFKIDLKEFTHLITQMAMKLFPEAIMGGGDPLMELLKWHILPFYGEYQPGTQLDDLMKPSVNEELLDFRQQLRRIYAHYCTLDMASFTYSDWKTVRQHDRTLTRAEWLKFLLNFQVVPHLLSKNEALRIFHVSNQDADFPQMEPTGLMSFPHFLESLGRLAQRIFGGVPARLADPDAPLGELSAIRRLAAGVPDPAARKEILGQFARRYTYRPGDAMTARGRESLRHTILSEHTEDRRVRIHEASERRLQRTLDRGAAQRIIMREAAAFGLGPAAPPTLEALSGLPHEAVRDAVAIGRTRPHPGLKVTVGTIGDYIQKDLDVTGTIRGLGPLFPDSHPSPGGQGAYVPQPPSPASRSGGGESMGRAGGSSPGSYPRGGGGGAVPELPLGAGIGVTPWSLGGAASARLSHGSSAGVVRSPRVVRAYHGAAASAVRGEIRGFEDAAVGGKKTWGKPNSREMQGWGAGAWDPAMDPRLPLPPILHPEGMQGK